MTHTPNIHTQHTPHNEPREQNSSVSEEEIARFSALAKNWWDPNGPMRLLHAMNPSRITWAMRHMPPPLQENSSPAHRTRVLDIGCGAGIASESFAKAGYDVLGLDASAEGISAAQAHFVSAQLPEQVALRYRCSNAETLVQEKQYFDVVVAFELIEHVTDPQHFMSLLAHLVTPGGTLIVSTLNRTLRSLMIGKIAAEYLFHFVPVGTHEWRKFILPSELGHYARQVGLSMTTLTGFSAFSGRWQESSDLGMNYTAAFKKL